MSELPAEEMLLAVAATISKEEIDSMISNTELSELIKTQIMSGLLINISTVGKDTSNYLNANSKRKIK